MVKRKERFDWEDFWESFPWWWILIGIIIIGSVIRGIVEAGKPDVPKEQAVVIEFVEDAAFDQHKVQFLSDRSVRMERLDDGIIVGDTVLIEK